MTPYTLYYASEDVDPERGGGIGTWSVYSEQYADIIDADPIEGTTVLVSGNHPTEASAQDCARSKQRASYSENRRANDGA